MPRQQSSAAPELTGNKPSAKQPRLAVSAANAFTAAQLLAFERKGHLTSRRLFSESELAPLVQPLLSQLQREELAAWRQRVSVLAPRAAQPRSVGEAKALLAKHAGGETVGFLQHFNLHRGGSEVAAPLRELARGRLAACAAALLGAPRIRLYQTCVFVKQPGMGETHWHSDLAMVPLDTNAYVTAWLPLRSLSAADAALDFASGSHRDFALPFWHSDEAMGSDLGSRGYRVEPPGGGPLRLGDATWHAGWTLHCSPAQPREARSRAALTLSFFADGARRLPPDRELRRGVHPEDAAGSADWLGAVPHGAVARHDLLPLVYG